MEWINGQWLRSLLSCARVWRPHPFMTLAHSVCQGRTYARVLNFVRRRGLPTHSTNEALSSLSVPRYPDRKNMRSPASPASQLGFTRIMAA